MNSIKNGQEKTDRATRWFKDGKFHRDNDLPAIENINGTKEWYIDGQRHRENKPAFIHYSGEEQWWFEGKAHREDGPAIIWSTGEKEWWIHGIKYTEEEFSNYLEKKELNNALNLDLHEKNNKTKIKL